MDVLDRGIIGAPAGQARRGTPRIQSSAQACLGRPEQARGIIERDGGEQAPLEATLSQGTQRRPGMRRARTTSRWNRSSRNDNASGGPSQRDAQKKRQRTQRRSRRGAAAWHYRRHGDKGCHADGISAHSCRTTKALPRCSALAAVAAGLLLRPLPSLLASDGPGHRTGGIWCGGRPSGRAGHGCSCR